ncbi:HNH endonuclease [Frankia sp. EI5c]|uniref:HNH endonuclease n=1 Tax=Frankia sp. EI5c TaxID=683316 RepID=UPI000FF878CA
MPAATPLSPLDVKREREKAKKEARKKWIRQNGGSGVTKAEKKAIRESSNCVWCSAPADETDHLFPLSRGGPDEVSGIVASCGRCNRSRGNKLLTEWDWTRVCRGLLSNDAVGRELARLSGEDKDPTDHIPTGRRPTHT